MHDITKGVLYLELRYTLQIRYGRAYCQLIREPNKEKRLYWARQHLNNNFDDDLWTDHRSVQLETHKRFCYRKQGKSPRLKPRYIQYINNS